MFRLFICLFRQYPGPMFLLRFLCRWNLFIVGNPSATHSRKYQTSIKRFKLLPRLVVIYVAFFSPLYPRHAKCASVRGFSLRAMILLFKSFQPFDETTQRAMVGGVIVCLSTALIDSWAENGNFVDVHFLLLCKVLLLLEL